ncbi:MAG TPA: methylated-DNA--[protein]-cysteine S-methyltransferase [Stenomitos sp.]
MTIRYAWLASPLGAVLVASTERGVCYVSFGEGQPEAMEGLRRQYPGAELREDEAGLPDVCAELAEYFAGDRRTFSFPLDPKGTEFQRKVWAALGDIPYGRTWSYRDLAEHVGSPNGFRAVGLANRSNPIGIVVPCHRVVGADGSLVGYAGGLEAKRWLLEHERRVAGHTLF